ncbi:MAG TPA: FAD-dependent oxidoreductase [Pseudobdellovibrionaceae bacterium]|nr:FAD-dependent oxidoreductase [Pseudobdellovibrionaceae bacterium]
MAKVVIMGAGISGHTAALYLKRGLPKEHEVIVVSPNSKWNWIPSNIWVGVGVLNKEDVTFPLQPVYDKVGIQFHQAKAVSIHPEGSVQQLKPYIKIESTKDQDKGQTAEITYDFLINATGPKLNFTATPGLGPESNSLSVCTFSHAEETAKELAHCIERMRKGEQLTFVIGTGHGMCTCEGAAFEYVFNLEFELQRAGVRNKARLVFLTNEAELGDFGVGGMIFETGGFTVPSKVFAESMFTERNIEVIKGAHVEKVDKNSVSYELLSGEKGTVSFDFAMLLPPFSGVGLKSFAKDGSEITEKLFAPNGFLKVDAHYEAKTYEEWAPTDWPSTYQNQTFKNIFGIGIAFAPPHPISKPRKSKNGTNITPAPPRTGMPSAIMGRVVAHSIIEMIQTGKTDAPYGASLAEIGAACVASAGANWFKGSAASMTMYPIVPDYRRYPRGGRSMVYTFGEVGAAGHWIKQILHYMFLYKAQAKPFWWLIPE